MLHFQIAQGNAAPAYRQMMDQVKYYVASGVLGKGDRLPSIRELAKKLGVNPTTVVKAYTELEHEGVIERKQGKGVFVSEKARSLSNVEADKVLRRLARGLAVEARQLGVSKEMAVRLLREEMKGLESERGRK
jgi:GntR family transcriptional regulator